MSCLGCREARLERQAPFGSGRVEQSDLRVGPKAYHPRAGLAKVAAEPAQLGVHPAGLLVVGQDADPVGLGAEVIGMPVPVLDHLRAPGNEGPCGLAPLPVEGREVDRRTADGSGVGFGDQERRLLGCIHSVGAQEQAPGARRRPALRLDTRGRHGQRVLHGVVGVAGGDVEGAGEICVVDSGALVRDAGGDELVVTGVLPNDVGLPGDELGGELGLEASARRGRTEVASCRRGSTGPPTCSACATSTRAPTPR